MASSTGDKVGWIGLGDQGVPLVSRMIEAGVDVVLWARRPASLEPFRQSTAEVAGTLRELGDLCRVVCVCVTADDDVHQVVVDGGLLDAMSPGSVIVIHSTVRPDTCTRLAERARHRDVAVVDAPVSRDGADQFTARFTLLVGGDAAVVGSIRDLLATYADVVRHLGPLGSGQRMKIINNTLVAGNLALLSEALRFGAALGIEREEMLATLRSTSGGSRAVEFIHFYEPDVRELYARLLAKDVRAFDSLPSDRRPELLELAAGRFIVDILGRIEHGPADQHI